MTVTKQMDGDILKVALDGRLDTLTSPELEAELKDSLAGVGELIFDLEKLEYISSAGLRVFLSAYKLIGKPGCVKAVNVNDTVAGVFEVTGFDEILDIER